MESKWDSDLMPPKRKVHLPPVLKREKECGVRILSGMAEMHYYTFRHFGERQKNTQTQNRKKSIRQNPKTTLQRLAAEGLKNPVNKPKTEYVPVAQQDRAVAS